LTDNARNVGQSLLSAAPMSENQKESHSKDTHKDARAQASKAGVATRLCAARAVASVVTDQIPLEQSFADQTGFMKLSGRDRAFARLIAATVFRRSGQIGAALKPFIRKKPSALPHAMLRCGAAQLIFLKTPMHAAVGESVAAIKSVRGHEHNAGMMNAILRRVSEKGVAFAGARPPRDNIPGWLRGSWERAYGSPEMRRMALQLQKDPPLDLSVKSDPEGWAERLGGIVLPTGSVRLESIGDVTALEGFEDGDWWVQDVAASLPVKMLGDVSGKRVLDMCAAPGGKTLQLAAAGANVTAIDRSEVRLERVTENLQRTKLKADIRAIDAFDFPEDEGGFDAVLLDAPCSATGTYRRHPDVLHNKTAKDVSKLSRLQAKLLEKAASLVAPGGSLLYCTCSLQPEEGELQLGRFLEKWTDFRLISPLNGKASDIPEAVTNEGYVRSLPHFLGEKGGMDGFFIGLMIKEK